MFADYLDRGFFADDRMLSGIHLSHSAFGHEPFTTLALAVFGTKISLPRLANSNSPTICPSGRGCCSISLYAVRKWGAGPKPPRTSKNTWMRIPRRTIATSSNRAFFDFDEW